MQCANPLRRASSLRRASPSQSKRAGLLTLAETVREPGEACVEVRSAGAKGFGVFAGETLARNTWVGRYVGDLVTDEDIRQCYGVAGSRDYVAPDYIFRLRDELSLDAQNSTHFSRFINHAEFSNLDVEVDEEELTIDFYVSSWGDIASGDELTFDYGPAYWRFRSAPVGDGRNFSDPIYFDEPEYSLIYPPPVGTKLPLVPLDTAELPAALALPEAECVAALLRCLDFFGCAPRAADGALEVRFGVGADAERLVLSEGDGPPSLTDLQRAALACIVQSVLDPLDDSGEATAEFEAWVEATDAELSLLRRWRERVPRFASARHDAAAAAAFLLWKNPNAHDVHRPLQRDVCNALVAEVGVEHEGALGYVLEMLALHAPEEHVAELVGTLERWFQLGDGCTVVSNDGVPALAGAVPQHLETIWKRVPRLVESGLLRYNHHDGNSR